MTQIVVSAIGRDRPGIVAGMTGALVEHGANIADSQMAILRGHFAMTLIVSTDADIEALATGLQDAADRLGLEALLVREVTEAAEQVDPTHIVTVYGADHPGIVHAVASALADDGVSITDLNTRLMEDAEGGEPLYVMMLEVAAPGGVDLDAVAADQGVEVTVRELEAEAL